MRPYAVWMQHPFFLMCLTVSNASHCPSLSHTFPACSELIRLDETIRSVDSEATDLGASPPQGLPPKHWWYACRGQLAGAAC